MEGKRSYQEELRTQIQLLIKLFWVHHQQKELAKSITQPFYQPCLFSHQCLFLTLAVLDRAYFRDMLIFDAMFIFARVRL